MKVCIVGTSRCGTTLLRNLLHEHHDLVVLNETHWFPKMFEVAGTQRIQWQRLMDIVDRTTWDTGKDLISVNAELAGFESRAQLLDVFQPLLIERGRVTIREFNDLLVRVLYGDGIFWGDKTPDYGFYMAQVQNIWPNCKFIHVVRGGLETALSMSRHPGCMLMISNGFDNWCSLAYDQLYEKYKIKEIPLEQYVSGWRRRLYRIRDEATRVRPGTYLEIRYESLLNNPQEILLDVAKYLDLRADPSWLRACARAIRPQTVISPDDALLARITAEDLLALNKEETYHFFTVPWESEVEFVLEKRSDVTRALDSGRYRPAFRGAVSLLATNVGVFDKEVRKTVESLRKNAFEYMTKS